MDDTTEMGNRGRQSIQELRLDLGFLQPTQSFSHGMFDTRLDRCIGWILSPIKPPNHSKIVGWIKNTFVENQQMV